MMITLKYYTWTWESQPRKRCKKSVKPTTPNKTTFE